jgi:hypothetical protein
VNTHNKKKLLKTIFLTMRKHKRYQRLNIAKDKDLVSIKLNKVLVEFGINSANNKKSCVQVRPETLKVIYSALRTKAINYDTDKLECHIKAALREKNLFPALAIRNINKGELPDLSYDNADIASIWIASPPCQQFSKSKECINKKYG